MATEPRYRRLRRRLACENSLFEVYFDAVEAPGGDVIEDFLVVRTKITAPGNIAGICVLPELEGRVGLMRGYRHQLDDYVWQAPAGFIDAGETAEQAAFRELTEETELRCERNNLTLLGVHYPDAGLIEGRVAIFVAKNCFVATEPTKIQPEIGVAELHFFDRRSLEQLLTTTSSIGASTLIACLRYLYSVDKEHDGGI
jgi:ADP-ribose pyrophosphatase